VSVSNSVEVLIAQLSHQVDQGFARLQSDLDKVQKDVKDLHREAIPLRVKALETWRSGLATWLWTFLIGCAVASVSAWIAVVTRSTGKG
jgi:hypothetical protein